MSRFPRLLTAACVLLFAAAPLRAQEAAAPPEAVEEALEEEASQATPETLALAERYLTLPAIQQMNDQLYGGNVLDSMMAMQEGLPDEVRSAMAKILREEFAKMRPALEEVMIETAAETYSAAELEALIAFYESPEGASVAVKTGPFTQKVFVNFSDGLADFQQAVVKRLTEELK